MTSWRRRSVEVVNQTANPPSGVLSRKFPKEKTRPSTVSCSIQVANLRIDGRNRPTSQFKKTGNFTPKNYGAQSKTVNSCEGSLPWCLSVVWHCIRPGPPKIPYLQNKRKRSLSEVQEVVIPFTPCWVRHWTQRASRRATTGSLLIDH